MKAYIAWMTSAGLLLPGVQLPAQNPEPKPEPPKQAQEIPAPKHPGDKQMEKGAFLGVAVAPAPPSLRAQLGLPEGTGLLVLHVEPESVAVGKLQENDILTRFNDQILINPEQLTVLVYNAGIGTEVKLTQIRKKNEETVTVRLGEREMPDGMFTMPQFGWFGEPWRKHEDAVREWRERAGEMRERAGERMRDFREKREQRRAPEAQKEDSGREQPGRQTTMKHSTWVEDGLILNLVQTGEGKRLTVQKNGQKVFEGPVDTQEQIQKVPQEYREKLDKMDATGAPKEKRDSGDIL